jgi:DNA-binding CsgD family transcriptional regulator
MSRINITQTVNIRNLTVVVGASCCLSITLLRMSGFLHQRIGTEDLPWEGLLAAGVISTLVIACGQFLQYPTVRNILTALTGCSTLLWFVSIIYFACFGYSGEVGLERLMLFNLGIFTISLLIQWNLHFALNRNEDLSFVVSGTVFLTLALSLLLVNSSFLFWGFLFLLSALSCILCLWANFNFASNPKSPWGIEAVVKHDVNVNIKRSKKSQRLFFGSRICWGLGYGIVFGLAVNLYELSGFEDSLGGKIMLLISGLFFALYVYLANRGLVAIYYLILLPFVVVLIVALSTPFFTIRALCTSAWLVWYAQSYVQLPTYRRLLKINVARFAYFEKALTLLVFSVTSLAVSNVAGRFIVASLHWANELLAILLVVVLLGLFTFSIARHVLLYLPNPGINDFDYPEKDGLIKQIANAYGLTVRETDVLFLLAKGYDRKYLEKALYISPGTARTHMNHIYQKLGVNSQNELIGLVMKGYQKPDSQSSRGLP